MTYDSTAQHNIVACCVGIVRALVLIPNEQCAVSQSNSIKISSFQGTSFHMPRSSVEKAEKYTEHVQSRGTSQRHARRNNDANASLIPRRSLPRRQGKHPQQCPFQETPR